MRSSKKRSRSSQNRPRTLGNIVNRVFDSSGPEGKVRGTPQQIIEKYQMLARDAQLSNDRVAAENFLQHAEHYTRMLAEAMREMAAEQEARQQQYQQNGGQGQIGQGQIGQGQVGQGQAGQGQIGLGQIGQGQGGQGQGGQSYRTERQVERPDRPERPDRAERPDRGDRADRRNDFGRDNRDPGNAEQPHVVEVIDLGGNETSGLIETPESTPRTRGAARLPHQSEPRAEPRAGASAGASAETGETAPREDRPAAPRRPRAPRKPRAESKPDGEPPKEAAE